MSGQVHAAEWAFEVRDVSFSYRDVLALDALSLNIRRGERIALIGANGSGKSTLLRILAGLSFPQHGRVRFFGEHLTEDRLEQDDFFFQFRRRVGVLFQNPDVQLFNASVFDEIAFGPLQLHWPREHVRHAVEQTLEAMRISQLRDRPPHRLSGGEKKRVALASVLVLDPEVLLLDEPTDALDPTSENRILELLESWGGGSKTVISSTHDLDSLEQIADRCYVLHNGHVAGEGLPVAVLHDLRLLAGANLMRPHHHRHELGKALSHPHVHVEDL